MDILGVLDLDGFFHRKKFQCRELAFVSLHGPPHFNIKFRPHITWDTLTEKERKNLFFVSRCITGLPVQARDLEGALPQTAVAESFKKIYMQLVETYGHKTVAFRGGHVEQDLLEKSGIPYLDLSLHQCPKFNELIKDCEHLNDYDCGHHVKAVTPNYHCASVEVEVFKLWLQKNPL